MISNKTLLILTVKAGNMLRRVCEIKKNIYKRLKFVFDFQEFDDLEFFPATMQLIVYKYKKYPNDKKKTDCEH